MHRRIGIYCRDAAQVGLDQVGLGVGAKQGKPPPPRSSAQPDDTGRGAGGDGVGSAMSFGSNSGGGSGGGGGGGGTGGASDGPGDSAGGGGSDDGGGDGGGAETPGTYVKDTWGDFLDTPRQSQSPPPSPPSSTTPTSAADDGSPRASLWDEAAPRGRDEAPRGAKGGGGGGGARGGHGHTSPAGFSARGAASWCLHDPHAPPLLFLLFVFVVDVAIAAGLRAHDPDLHPDIESVFQDGSYHAQARRMQPSSRSAYRRVNESSSVPTCDHARSG